jgi:dihydrofolate reductase
MSRVVAIEHVTLDGVMQAPGRPDEDTRGGFAHGGWATERQDEVMGRRLGEGMRRGGSLLFGRRTYEDFHAVWPAQKGNPVAEVLDRATKYVASTTLREPLEWQNSVLLGDDVPAAVAALRAGSGPDIGVLGSGELLASLLRHGLVDELFLMIHPLVLGTGRRLFADGLPPAALELADSLTTTTGVIMATYRPAAGRP